MRYLMLHNIVQGFVCTPWDGSGCPLLCGQHCLELMIDCHYPTTAGKGPSEIPDVTE